MKIVVNSAHPVPQTHDFNDLTKDALPHNCIHDLTTEILLGIPKLHFSGILPTISRKVDEMFTF